MVYVWSPLYRWLRYALYLYPSIVVVGNCRPLTSSRHCLALPPRSHRLPTVLFVHGGQQDKANHRARQARQKRVERQQHQSQLQVHHQHYCGRPMTMTSSIVLRSSYYISSHSSSCIRDYSARPRIDISYPLAVYWSTEVSG